MGQFPQILDDDGITRNKLSHSDPKIAPATGITIVAADKCFAVLHYTGVIEQRDK